MVHGNTPSEVDPQLGGGKKHLEAEGGTNEEGLRGSVGTVQNCSLSFFFFYGVFFFNFILFLNFTKLY